MASTRGHRPQYAQHHRQARKAYEAALPLPCVFCGRLIHPGQEFDLDHVPGTTDKYRGVAHPNENRSEGAARGNRMRGKGIIMKSTASWLGVDTSNDRSVTSVAVVRWGKVAGLGAEKMHAELHRFSGPAPLEQVLALYGDGGLDAAVDGTGHMRSFSDALKGRGVNVVAMSAQDRAAATACLKDALNDGAIRVPRDDFLTRAVQHARERDLVGGSTLDKRRSPVDVSPLVALELATWAATKDRDSDYDPLDSVL